ncbi:MAG: alpha/beta fold hydrolase [Chloroflexi bacterium]|nr:alpha/beta fold hydrolase [Chloroflexota bacterium]
MAPPIDILLPGRRQTGVLLLHGLTGTPLEMQCLGETLAAEGYTVHIPLLPGRGTVPDDMDALCWEDWMQAALRAYDGLKREHAQVVVGGLSAGGTMALDLALRRDPAALLLYAAVLSVAHRGAYLAPFVWRIVRRWPSPPSDMVEPNEALQCYDPAPVRAMGELLSGIGRVRPRLGQIAAPAFVAHSVQDRLVPLTSAREIAARLAGPVETLFLEGTGHAITCDAKRADVAEASRTFLRRNLGRSVAQPQYFPQLRTA